MHIDGRSISANTTLDSDICIVGAGPAGLSLADSLRNSGQRTTLIEEGGIVPPGDASALAAAILRLAQVYALLQNGVGCRRSIHAPVRTRGKRKAVARIAEESCWHRPALKDHSAKRT
jgi:2-polyprenyl-6-methoxyphenol hydroxylase-like FAD-dependent oxidoreductase